MVPNGRVRRADGDRKAARAGTAKAVRINRPGRRRAARVTRRGTGDAFDQQIANLQRGNGALIKRDRRGRRRRHHSSSQQDPNASYRT